MWISAVYESVVVTLLTLIVKCGHQLFTTQGKVGTLAVYSQVVLRSLCVSQFGLAVRH